MSRAERFAIGFVVAIGGALFRLPKRMPYHLAMELALTGEFRDAEFFQRLGIVNRMTAPGEALSEALKLAEGLLRNGPTALAASKEIMQRSADWTEEEAEQLFRGHCDIVVYAPHAIEGANGSE